jgi:hypothetical protein
VDKKMEVAQTLANDYPGRLVVLSECSHDKEKIKHHRDYDKPYEVDLVCRRCHCALHGKKNNGRTLRDWKVIVAETQKNPAFLGPGFGGVLLLLSDF